MPGTKMNISSGKQAAPVLHLVGYIAIGV